MTGQPATAAPRPSGRTKLTPEREQELYEAVLDLLRERGYDALTMDAVAVRTKSSKATLYRQWGTKLQLVVSAMRHTKRVSLGDIDTGSLVGDLREMARRVGDEAGDDTALLHALSHAGQRDADIRLAMREVLLEPEIEVLNTALRRGMERGELAPGNPAVEFLVHAFMGALVTRPMLEDRYADAEYLNRFLDAVILPALRREPGSRAG
ncbi:TetR/AcrR family transcriptional regulator [Streptomyces sp. ACA25]|uniref:TetR/AcrR family transcriptional regulator n=1 Tax=Streptomyces sp. ACA25 TaxID=3022596 RepID=UPI002307BF2A|nr:TetR/AcrR family transcriptional regulator [Streptomyces sp. ACA25]MDB1089767.1 TetR/AcrR family transcriptional regulator [Streptomyces sp. ACA25]